MKSDKQRLKEAKKMYPVGTSFISLFGAGDTVTEPTSISGKKKEALYIGDGGTIMAHGRHESRMIYDNGRWAEIRKVEKGSRVYFPAKVRGAIVELKGIVQRLAKDGTTAFVYAKSHDLTVRLAKRKIAVAPFKYPMEEF